MSEKIVRRPLNLLQFASIEHEQFLVSLANNKDDLQILTHIQGLYEAALTERSAREDDMVLFQLLAFTHYHFLFATACLMRCHLSEAFASARAAIDGGLIGAQIIHDRASQVAYLNRTKPFDKLARYLRNLIRDGKPLPHHLVQPLLDLHSSFSTFSSHADVDSFVHRINFIKEPGNRMIAVQYFQFSGDDAEREIHALTLFQTFVMVLDVFSDFLVAEQKVVPREWQEELWGLGRAIERRRKALQGSLTTDGSSKG